MPNPRSKFVLKILKKTYKFGPFCCSCGLILTYPEDTQSASAVRSDDVRCSPAAVGTSSDRGALSVNNNISYSYHTIGVAL